MMRCFVALIWILLSTVAVGQELTQGSSPYWEWSPKQEYHAAAVRVSVPGGAGTGVIIEHKNRDGGTEGVLVLTNAHVVEAGQSRRYYNTATVTDRTVRRLPSMSLAFDLRLQRTLLFCTLHETALARGCDWLTSTPRSMHPWN